MLFMAVTLCPVRRSIPDVVTCLRCVYPEHGCCCPHGHNRRRHECGRPALGAPGAEIRLKTYQYQGPLRTTPIIIRQVHIHDEVLQLRRAR